MNIAYRQPRGYVMDRVKVDLKNCYGIKSLKRDFDYSDTPAYALYAPNGVMKSSLAETFLDASNSEPGDRKESVDRIFPDRETQRKITDETDTEIEGERVLVIPSYDAEFGPTEKTSTLLVSADLRKESERLERTVDQAKSALLKAVKAQASSKKDFDDEISVAVMRGQDRFEDAVLRLQREIERQTEAPFANLKYDVVFNDAVVNALGDKKIAAAIDDYIKRYNDLLAASNYFKKGTFDYYNAGQIARSLASNGFFDARHTVSLYGGEGTVEIKNQKELEDIISKEKEAILTDAKLRSNFNAIQKQLEKNVALRDFCHLLQEDEAVLSRMDNVELFRTDVLMSYLKVNEVLYKDLVQTIETVEKRRKEIATEARRQTTQWDSVIQIFNERFFVPFDLVAINKVEVMLGQAQIPVLGFVYKDGDERVNLDKEDLIRSLSTGERKALYILNVIFEVERRRADKVETLVVVDDIADSFDYNNKYAIIQYLKDISEDGLFKLIIMTHNFDFFRTVQSRFVKYSKCLMACKNENGITLAQASGIKNVFAKDWKDNFHKDVRKRLASIPFLRNIVEMTSGVKNQTYLDLTSMLHWKSDTSKMTVAKLDGIFNNMCGTSGSSPDPDKTVADLVLEEAKKCLSESGGMKLQNKIVLAVGIRLCAERYIISKIKDDSFVSAIDENQTRELIDRYKTDFKSESATIRILDRVEIMTPENIHVNSFMYEPILDMSDDHLKALFKDVECLK